MTLWDLYLKDSPKESFPTVPSYLLPFKFRPTETGETGDMLDVDADILDLKGCKEDLGEAWMNACEAEVVGASASKKTPRGGHDAEGEDERSKEADELRRRVQELEEELRMLREKKVEESASS